MKTYTIPEAARKLEIPEAHVKRLIKSWHLEVMSGHGKGNIKRLSGEDVERVLLERIHTGATQHFKQVATIDVPDYVDAALEVSGLRVLPSGNLLDAISAQQRDIKPIVISSMQAREDDKVLFAAYSGKISQIIWNEDLTLRRLVQFAWSLVHERKK